MPKPPVKLLDIVALLEDKPEAGLISGQVGTIVEVHSPLAFDVEFVDTDGRTIALVELQRHEFLLLRKEPAAIA